MAALTDHAMPTLRKLNICIGNQYSIIKIDSCVQSNTLLGKVEPSGIQNQPTNEGCSLEARPSGIDDRSSRVMVQVVPHKQSGTFRE